MHLVMKKKGSKIPTPLSLYSVPAMTTNSQTVTAAVIGGVVGVILSINTAVIVTVIVVLLRNSRKPYFTGTQKTYVYVTSSLHRGRESVSKVGSGAVFMKWGV